MPDAWWCETKCSSTTGENSSRMEISIPSISSSTHRGTAALCCRFWARKGARCRSGVTRAPAASQALPSRLCPLCGIVGPQRGWAGGPGLYWNLEWHQCCGRGPPQRCPHLSPFHGSCWVRGSCRPPCSWYPVINAFERLGPAIRGKGFRWRTKRGSSTSEITSLPLVTLCPSLHPSKPAYPLQSGRVYPSDSESYSTYWRVCRWALMLLLNPYFWLFFMNDLH